MSIPVPYRIVLTIALDIEDVDLAGLHDIVKDLPNDLKSTFASYDMDLKGIAIKTDPPIK